MADPDTPLAVGIAREPDDQGEVRDCSSRHD
jgi:hypothetical protein